MPSRRSVIEKGAHVCLGALAGSSLASAQETTAAQKFLLVGLCGSENPTRANFPFVWSVALKQAGNDVRIELAGDATGRRLYARTRRAGVPAPARPTRCRARRRPGTPG